ncbi:hypothetical protein WICPIJ_007513 [Wickerhamomyces pijperi]|uniref:Palmitoyltransferase n=1 Tax=Wickerhamomyces pijperi TaxID=599730 RepID=A0A9P8Q0D6_WICPI|nr:hypothetical protein WICPIJ_007513 [Wickerhamomyces pijperi]
MPVIPSVLIASIGYGGHFFVFSETFTTYEQYWFQFCLSMLWLSYYLAITTSPGSPPSDFKTLPYEWHRWCKKCEGYKPERSHHCKTCGICVLKMDHHCPWTANCVGFANMPHFMRFLLWVDYTNFVAFKGILSKSITFWNERSAPIYLISKTQLTATIVLFFMSLFVLCTVGLLTLRELQGILFTGRTQIETWDMDRIRDHIETMGFVEKIQKSYKELFGKELQNLMSWSSSHKRELTAGVPILTEDDIVFPYFTNPIDNIFQCMGYPWNWLNPFGGPAGTGLTFKKNPDCVYDPKDSESQDFCVMPWPMDGGHQDQDQIEDSEVSMDSVETDDGDEQIIEDNEIVIRSRPLIKRSQWRNEYGESLGDLGVEE